MKKNVMMRVAALLLVCVLATTCGISGTFAKYVTSDNGSDVARVAKWGVTATVDGTLFATTYKNVANNNVPGESDESVLTVVSSNTTDKLVAPGTQNTEGMSFKLTGTPEVDVTVVFKFEVVDNKEIKLAVGEYYDPTTGDENDTFKVDNDYYPVVFTLKKDGQTLVSGNVATINNWLNTYLNGTYQANTDLSNINIDGEGAYTLTWAWAFDNNMDAADTYLGNAIAGGGAVGATTDIEVKFTITVTQVD